MSTRSAKQGPRVAAPPKGSHAPGLMEVGPEKGNLLAVTLGTLAGLHERARAALTALEQGRPDRFKTAARERLEGLHARVIACTSLLPQEGQGNASGTSLRVMVPSSNIRAALIDCKAVRQALGGMKLRTEVRTTVGRELVAIEGVATQLLQPDMDLFARDKEPQK